jgi:hypothetical protein
MKNKRKKSLAIIGLFLMAAFGMSSCDDETNSHPPAIQEAQPIEKQPVTEDEHIGHTRELIKSYMVYVDEMDIRQDSGNCDHIMEYMADHNKEFKQASNGLVEEMKWLGVVEDGDNLITFRDMKLSAELSEWNRRVILELKKQHVANVNCGWQK